MRELQCTELPNLLSCSHAEILPLNEKMKLLRNDSHRGYTPHLDEILDPQNLLHGDFKEGYYISIVKGGKCKREKAAYQIFVHLLFVYDLYTEKWKKHLQR